MQKGIIKNVNRITGEPVDAKDLASIFSGIVGNESGVLTVFEELRLEKISDNKVRLHSGVYSLKGHMLYIPKGSYEDFEIDSGTLGANRIDLLVAEYVKNGEGEGEDTLRFRVIKGETTSGTAQAPQLTQQDINANGITRQEALYQIKLNGLELKINALYSKIYSSNNLKQKYEELELLIKNREPKIIKDWTVRDLGGGYFDIGFHTETLASTGSRKVNLPFSIDIKKAIVSIGVVYNSAPEITVTYAFLTNTSINLYLTSSITGKPITQNQHISIRILSQKI